MFADSSSADHATLINNGATVGGGGGGVTRFIETSRAGSATLIANAGQSGGKGAVIEFRDRADGGQASVQVFGNGTLQVVNSTQDKVSIGSLEGDGIVSLGSPTVALAVGTNNLSTTFSGLIQNGAGSNDGSLTKTGTGKLTLSGANTYNGGTTINGGTLLSQTHAAPALATVRFRLTPVNLAGRVR